jgi:hypothetical protein
MEHSAAHRVKKSLGQFRLLVAGEQPDVVQLDLLPDGFVKRIGIVTTTQVFLALDNTLVVKGDALSRDALQFMPIAFLEQRLAMTADFAKQSVVAIETIEHPLCNEECEVVLCLRSCCCHRNYKLSNRRERKGRRG